MSRRVSLFYKIIKIVEKMFHYYCETERFKEFEESVYKEFSSLKDSIHEFQKSTHQELNLQSKKYKEELFEKQREIITATNKKLEGFTQLSTHQTQVAAINSDIKVILSKMAMASEDLQEIRSVSDAIDSKLGQKVE